MFLYAHHRIDQAMQAIVLSFVTYGNAITLFAEATPTTKASLPVKKNNTEIKNSTKTILVTGGAGFLGSNLCARLLDQGHKVIALDNLYTGRQENIAPLLKNKNFKFIKHDIINPIDIAVDWIFNFACPASPPHYQKDPIFTTKTSVLGALNMLELARKHKARIMQASTSEVYGNPLVHPQTEVYLGNVNCTGPRACYDEGKRCAESLFFDYHRTHGVDIKVIRIFNTYGPNMDPDDGRVVSNFIMQALKGTTLTMYGDGTQTRSFCYVDDLIDGIIAMMHTDSTVTGPVNLGNPHEFTLLELATKIQAALGTSLPINFLPLPPDDPLQRKPNITKAKQLFGWEPQVSLNEGLKKTIAYFRNISDTVRTRSTRPMGSLRANGNKHAATIKSNVPPVTTQAVTNPPFALSDEPREESNGYERDEKSTNGTTNP